MTVVSKQSGESVERLISRFRRKVIRKGTMKQVRAGKYFQKKDSKRLEKVKAQYRTKRRKELEKEAMGT